MTFLEKCFVYYFMDILFHSLPNYNFLEWFKLKAFSDHKIKVAEKMKIVLEGVQNIVGKGENAGYQHFLLFTRCFLKSSVSGSVKVRILWYRVKETKKMKDKTFEKQRNMNLFKINLHVTCMTKNS